VDIDDPALYVKSISFWRTAEALRMRLGKTGKVGALALRIVI
jgi:hypothetical protein